MRLLGISQRTCKFVLEGQLDVARIQSRSLNEAESVFSGKCLSLICGDSPKVPQIALVSHQHDDDVCVGMVAELFQPACDVLVGLVLGDVVDEEGADCATVVGAGDRTVTLLAGGIPDLSLDGLVVDLDAASGKLDADSGLAVEVEFVAGETREQVGFTNTRVSNKDNLEEELRMPISTCLCDREGLAAWSSSGAGAGVHRTRRWPWPRWMVLGGLVVERWRGQTQQRSSWLALSWAQVCWCAAKRAVVGEGQTMGGGMRQEECCAVGWVEVREIGIAVVCLAGWCLAALRCCSLTVTSPDSRDPGAKRT